MDVNNKFNSLSEKSIWAYTKQKANFKDLFLSAKLFDEITNIESTNIEQYFRNTFKRYGISTGRHRILALSQMFGLITKKRFYSKDRYNIERTTNVFRKMINSVVGDALFNEIMSEQLIKIKIRAIIDTTADREDYYIFPFLFLFFVMWELCKDNIKEVSFEKILTYVFTCKKMDEVGNAVSWIKNKNAPHISKALLNQYESDSRIGILIMENTRMFSFIRKNNKKYLKLNHPIAEEFYNSFVKKQNLPKLYKLLEDDNEYCEFLYNYQGFNFDLTGNQYLIENNKKPFVDYDNSIDNLYSKPENFDFFDIDEIVDNLEAAKIYYATPYKDSSKIASANNRIPRIAPGLEKHNRYTTDPKLAKTALSNAKYKCELSSLIEGINHSTFNTSGNRQYLEAHHLIPMKAQKDYAPNNINLDRLENIVALCPICHKAVHYGTKDVKYKFLKPLFDNRIERLKKAGVEISFDALIEKYYS